MRRSREMACECLKIQLKKILNGEGNHGVQEVINLAANVQGPLQEEVAPNDGGDGQNRNRLVIDGNEGAGK